MTTQTQQHQILPEGLTPAELKTIYEYMVIAREYDERCYKLQRQGRIGFYAGSYGEEACQIGTSFALGDRDWVFSAYRQVGVALYRGVELQTLINNLYGNAEDVVEGKQMPIHFTARKNRFLSISSVIGTQIIQAVGCAMAMKIKNDNSVAITYFGDGATSSSDFHSGMNFAAVYKAPCIFILNNNQYAISTPVKKQTAVEILAEKAKAYGMPGVHVDGNDVIAVYKATKEAIERARKGEGPTLVELKTYRAGPHSSSDDPSRYRSKEETEEWLKRDPIVLFQKRLEQWGLWNEPYEKELRESIQNRLSIAVKTAESIPQPKWETLFDDVYSYIPPVLADQKEDIITNESGLELTNEGEFPL